MLTHRGLALIALLLLAKFLFWQLQSALPAEPETPEPVDEPTATVPEPSPEPEVPPIAAPSPEEASVTELQARRLTIPVVGVEVDDLQDTYEDLRSGNRRHRAIDIMAPRGTPVVAVEDGTLARKFKSRLGGIALYLFDSSGSYCYFYAHLDAYAPDLAQGDVVQRGQVLGFVGSTGNAPDDVPHLHLAIHRRGESARYCEGPTLNPYLVFTGPPVE